MGADHSTDGLHHRLLQMQVLRYIAGKGADALGAAGIADYDGPCFINAAAPARQAIFRAGAPSRAAPEGDARPIEEQEKIL